jgi:rod shape-determining protein MreB and related proteins
MFEKIIKKTNTVLYIQIWENRIKVTNISSGKVYDEKPLIAIQKNNKGEEVVVGVGNSVELIDSESQTIIINPFSHSRTLLSNFVLAEKILQYIFEKLLKQQFLLLSPLAVVHPMEKIDDGITQVEFRAFKELALGAGARESVVCEGSELSIENFDYEKIKKEEILYNQNIGK